MPLLRLHPAGTAAVPAVRARGRAVLLAALAAALLLGAWISLGHCLDAWGTDADAADTVLLWSGAREHGLGFLTSWYYTQDNWLLSLLPLMSLAYAAFGTVPALVVGSGWAIFLACAGLTALLAWRVAGAEAAGLLLAVLLFANDRAAGAVGFLTYPVVHTITLAWGLAALALAARGVARGSGLALAGCGIALLVGAVSDPWLDATMVAPLLIASAVLAVLHRGTPAGRRCAALFLAVAVAGALARTRLAGLLPFLPGGQMDRADAAGIARNLGWLCRAAAAMFNILPGADTDAPAVVLIDDLALLAAGGTVALLALRRFRRAEIRFQLLAGAGLLSIAAVLAALLLGARPDGIYAGRYLANLYFLGPLLGALVLARSPARRVASTLRAALLGWAALFVLSGACSRPAAWAHGLPKLRTLGTTALADFLRSNGLTYGYAAYWGPEANAVAWMSRGQVVIRPVVFDRASSRVSPRTGQTSPLWYAASDISAGRAETFLIVMRDLENCPSAERCVAAAVAQFGPPSRRLSWSDRTMPCWPDAPPPARGGPARQFAEVIGARQPPPGCRAVRDMTILVWPREILSGMTP